MHLTDSTTKRASPCVPPTNEQARGLTLFVSKITTPGIRSQPELHATPPIASPSPTRHAPSPQSRHGAPRYALQSVSAAPYPVSSCLVTATTSEKLGEALPRRAQRSPKDLGEAYIDVTERKLGAHSSTHVREELREVQRSSEKFREAQRSSEELRGPSCPTRYDDTQHDATNAHVKSVSHGSLVETSGLF